MQYWACNFYALPPFTPHIALLGNVPNKLVEYVIHSFHQYLLNTYYVPGPLLGPLGKLLDNHHFIFKEPTPA